MSTVLSIKLRFSCLVLVACGIAPWAAGQKTYLTAADLVARPSPPADKRIHYGDGALQFGDLRLPEGEGPYPVAIVVHGGCWLAQYDIHHIGPFAKALTDEGIATWTIEYRRAGDEGGGWPATFLDVAAGTDYLRKLAEVYPLDLDRTIAVGHSAGGHFVLWLAGRHLIPKRSPLYIDNPLRLRGVLALSAAPDLARIHRSGSCDGAMDTIMGGSPVEVPEHYRNGSPIEMLPLGVPRILITGRHDRPMRRIEAIEAYAAKAAKLDDNARLVFAPESAHFEVIAPDSSTWPMVRDAAFELLGVTRE